MAWTISDHMQSLMQVVEEMHDARRALKERLPSTPRDRSRRRGYGDVVATRAYWAKQIGLLSSQEAYEAIQLERLFWKVHRDFLNAVRSLPETDKFIEVTA